MAKRSGKFVERLKFLVPILILVLGIGFVFAFEFYIKDKVNTVDVVVANKNIDFKEKITTDDIEIKSVKKDDQIEESFRPDELESIINTFASIEIKKGTQLYPELIDAYDLIPNEDEGEFIAPIPNTWLFAVPGSLRRSYVADVYVVGNKEQALLESLIKDSEDVNVDETENENNKNENDEQEELEENEEDDSPLNTDEEIDQVVKEMYKPILTNVRVASVKDGGNQEVTQQPESNNPDSATGNISTLEIIADDEMLSELREYTDRGFQLYIVYKYERGNEAKDEQIKSQNEEGEESE